MLHLHIAFTPSEKGGDWVLTPNPNIRGPPSTEYIENYWRVSEVYSTAVTVLNVLEHLEQKKQL